MFYWNVDFGDLKYKPTELTGTNKIQMMQYALRTRDAKGAHGSVRHSGKGHGALRVRRAA